MSLINEALKKAQKMRSEPQAGANPFAPPPPASSPAPVHVPSPAVSERTTTAQPGGFSGRSVAMIAGGAGLLACICILTTVLVLRKPGVSSSGSNELGVSPAITEARPRPPVPAERAPKGAEAPGAQSQAQVSLPTSQAATQTSSAPAIEATGLAPAAPRPSADLPAQGPSSKVPAAVVVASVRASEPSARKNAAPVISLPVIAGSAPEAAKPAVPVVQRKEQDVPVAAVAPSPILPAPLPKEQPMIQMPSSMSSVGSVREDNSLEQAAQQFVAKTRISGIRPGIKVLINGRAYKPNDMVESILGLRLVEIGQDRLVFADESGRRYTRGL